MTMRKGFTLIELLVAIAILGVVVFVAGGAMFRSCAATGQGSILVNPFHESTVVFKVVKSYAIAAPEGVAGSVYRVFAQVLQDTDGNLGEETFEIRDSWLDGKMMSADLFGKLQDQHTYRANCRGERSGVASSFRGIVSLEHIAEPE